MCSVSANAPLRLHTDSLMTTLHWNWERQSSQAFWLGDVIQKGRSPGKHVWWPRVTPRPRVEYGGKGCDASADTRYKGGGGWGNPGDNLITTRGRKMELASVNVTFGTFCWLSAQFNIDDDIQFCASSSSVVTGEPTRYRLSPDITQHGPARQGRKDRWEMDVSRYDGMQFGTGQKKIVLCAHCDPVGSGIIEAWAIFPKSHHTWHKRQPAGQRPH